MPVMTTQRKPLMMQQGFATTYAQGGSGIGSTQAGVQREVQANELTSTHLNELTKPGANNRYLENMRANARQGYAARGGGNTTLAAAGAEAAGLSAAGEIAARDAGVYDAAAGQNLDAASNRERLQMQMEDNRQQQELAYVRNNMGRLDAMAEAERDRQFRREESAADREWRTSEGREGRSWQSQENEAQRDFDWDSQEAQTRYAGVFRAMDTMFQSEDFWRDPAAAEGFMQFWSQQIPGLFQGVFQRGRGRP